MSSIAPQTPYLNSVLVTLDDLHLAVIKHAAVRLDDLRGLFDEGFPVLGQAIESGSVVPTGPGLALYQGEPMETFDLSIGFPIREPLSATLELNGLIIESVTIPSGMAAAASYFGSYQGLGEAWGRLLEFADSEGRTLRDGLMIEAYVSMPEEHSDPATLRTDLYALV